MPTNQLTDQQCKSAKPKEKAYKLFDGHGLHLVVNPTGSKLWRVSYRAAGKPQTASFGPYPLLTLADARAKRDALRRALANGESVKAATKPKAVRTLRQVSETYWEGRKDLSPGYRANAEAALERHIFPKLGARPVGELTRADVLAVLSAMDAAGLSVYVRKTRLWLLQVFDWAVEHEHAAINPCALIDPKKAFSKAPVESFAAIALAEVPAFMARLDLEASVQSALACRLLALTWVRTQELRMMEWAEIDGDLWRIPAAKMKRRREHLVPLSTQALQIIALMRKRSRGGVYVFPNDRRLDRPMSENAILYLIGRMGYRGRMTAHGFRSLASTVLNEQSGFAHDVIERQLAHKENDAVRAAYNRADYLPARRQMMMWWADWLAGQCGV